MKNALKLARDEGFTAGTIAALAVLALHDQETIWRDVLRAAGQQDEVIYYAAHIEPEDWEWGGFAHYIGKKPPKRRAARAAGGE